MIVVNGFSLSLTSIICPLAPPLCRIVAACRFCDRSMSNSRKLFAPNPYPVCHIVQAGWIERIYGDGDRNGNGEAVSVSHVDDESAGAGTCRCGGKRQAEVAAKTQRQLVGDVRRCKGDRVRSASHPG